MSSRDLPDANAILDRLKSVLGIKTDTELAQIFSLGQSSIASWRRRNSANDSKIIALCNEEGVSLDWLYAVEVQAPEAKSRAAPAPGGELEAENQRLHTEITSLRGKIEGLREALRLMGRGESPSEAARRRGGEETGFTATESERGEVENAR